MHQAAVEALAAGLPEGGDDAAGDAPAQAQAAGALQLALAVLRRAAGYGANVRCTCGVCLLPAAAKLVMEQCSTAADLEPAVEAVQALLAACCARRSGRLWLYVTVCMCCTEYKNVGLYLGQLSCVHLCPKQ